MKAIWKYTVNAPVQTIQMPAGAQVIHVANQFEDVTLWAIVDPDAEKVRRTFRVVGTGFLEVSDGDRYLGTAIVAAGQFVWHVFEVGGAS